LHFNQSTKIDKRRIGCRNFANSMGWTNSKYYMSERVERVYRRKEVRSRLAISDRCINLNIDPDICKDANLSLDDKIFNNARKRATAADAQWTGASVINVAARTSEMPRYQIISLGVAYKKFCNTEHTDPCRKIE
jgi:hypothetical protein